MLKLPRPRTVILDSGATLLHQRNPVSPTVAFGVWFKRGSRDERDSERGFSHFLEHMVFRGTNRRSALEIALDLESVGGQWDAFTSKEATCYHGRVIDEHFETLADVFADIVLFPSIPEQAFRLERNVIREEIRSVRDSPEEYVHELFFRALFGRHPLGHPVTGYESDIARCHRDDLIAFHRRSYTAADALLGFVGNPKPGTVAKILDGAFRFPRKRGGGRRRTPEPRRARTRSIRREDWLQSHVCIGCSTVAASSPEHYPIVILSNILGGGVSSRFFQRLREERGLVYSIYTHTSFWKDTGGFWTFFTVDPRRLPLVTEIFHEEMRSVMIEGVDEKELESAKAQLIGSVVIGIESANSRLFRLFHSEYYHGRYIPPAEVIRRIGGVSRASVIEAARRYLDPERLTYAVCGPVTLRGLVPDRGSGPGNLRTLRGRRR